MRHSLSRMRLIDSHCHIDLESFADDRHEVLAAAKRQGVSDIIVPAVTAVRWHDLQRLTSSEPADQPLLHAAYGLHPVFISEHHPNDLVNLERFLQTAKTVAVGECGLDYFIPEYDSAAQMHYFTAQLDLAVQYKRPVIIHARKALDLVLRELRLRPGLQGVIHSFSGSLQQAKQLIDLGFYLGFGGPVTYTRALKLRMLVSELPLSALLIETDAPDQPDASHHGERNQPAWLPDIAACIAQLRGIAVEAVAKTTSDNAKLLFNLS